MYRTFDDQNNQSHEPIVFIPDHQEEKPDAQPFPTGEEAFYNEEYEDGGEEEELPAAGEEDDYDEFSAAAMARPSKPEIAETSSLDVLPQARKLKDNTTAVTTTHQTSNAAMSSTQPVMMFPQSKSHITSSGKNLFSSPQHVLVSPLQPLSQPQQLSQPQSLSQTTAGAQQPTQQSVTKFTSGAAGATAQLQPTVGALQPKKQSTATIHCQAPKSIPVNASPLRSDQQQLHVIQHLGKPSLKLLLAQQTAKPDAATKSPPITSNCQSQTSIATSTQNRNSPTPRSSCISSGNPNRQHYHPTSKYQNTHSSSSRNAVQNSLGQLLQQQTTSMYAKQQQQQQQQAAAAIQGQYHAFATSLTSVPMKQSKSQQLQSNNSSAAATSMGFPKPRKAMAVQQKSAAAANAVVGSSGSNHPSTAKAADNRNAAKTTAANNNNSTKPKVGKQLTDMLLMQGGEEARPSMTGDIDDVANLVSPSPRRKPGKIYSAKKHSGNTRFTKLEIDNHDIGNSLVTEDSQVLYERGMKHKQPPFKLDSFDEDSMLNAARDFNSHLMTPQQISQFSASDQQQAFGNNAGGKGKQTQSKPGATSNLAQFQKHQPVQVQKQPLSATSSSAANHNHANAMSVSTKGSIANRQVPLQSSIETKKLTSKHPNSKMVKPYQSSSSGKYQQQHTIHKSPPKLFASKQSRLTGTTSNNPQSSAAAGGKQQPVPMRKPNIDAKALNQQSCDLIVSTDGNISELDRVEEREAMSVFNQQPALHKKKQQIGVYQPGHHAAAKQQNAASESTSNVAVLAQKKNAIKAAVTPKQIEIELGYEKEEELKQAAVLPKTGPSSNGGRNKPHLSRPVPVQQKSALEKSTSVAAPTCSVFLTSSFPATEQGEVPLDERVPNMVTTAVGASSQALKNNQIQASSTSPAADYSFKQKCRQKFLNQTTVIDLQPQTSQHQQPSNQSSVKDMKKTMPSSKIQPVPTLSLNSFKNRQMAPPVTSRNMASTTSSIVNNKKSQQVAQAQVQQQPRNPNFNKRGVAGGTGAAKADSSSHLVDPGTTTIANNGKNSATNQPLQACSSPQMAKTMESVASLQPIVETSKSASSNHQLFQSQQQTAKGSSKANASMSMAMVTTANVVLASGSSGPHQQPKTTGASKGITTSSSVDARRSAFRQRKPASVNREDLSVPATTIRSSHQPQHMMISLRPSQHNQQQQANISIDLTTATPAVTRQNRSTTQNNAGNHQSNSQYKTESLERILGSQAESYFRQIERTMQMAPVNVTGGTGSKDGGNSNSNGGATNAVSRSAQRQASLHSQSSRVSAKTAQPAQGISLAMPGIAEFSAINKFKAPTSTMNKKNNQLHSHALLVSNTTSNRETRLASVEKSKSSYKSANNAHSTNKLQQHQQPGGDLHFSSKAHQVINNTNDGSGNSYIFNKTVSGNPPTIATNTTTANAAARNDRLVAHRRIDLICCDLAGNNNHDQHNHSSSSDTGTMSQEMNSSSSRAAKMLLTNKCSFNNYNQQHASISGNKPGGMMSAAIMHNSNSSNNHTTNVQQQNSLLSQSSSGRRAYRKKSESLHNNNASSGPTPSQQHQSSANQQQQPPHQQLASKQLAIGAAKPGSVGRKNQIRLQQTTTAAAAASQQSSHHQTPQHQQPSGGEQQLLLLATTRNSKSSFSSTHRLQHSSKQSIAKDWVMCLPNEPPQVIKSHNQPDVIATMGGGAGELQPQPQESGKPGTAVLNSEMSSARATARDGKSLLHPSAKKKVQMNLANASSKESVKNVSGNPDVAHEAKITGFPQQKNAGTRKGKAGAETTSQPQFQSTSKAKDGTTANTSGGETQIQSAYISKVIKKQQSSQKQKHDIGLSSKHSVPASMQKHNSENSSQQQLMRSSYEPQHSAAAGATQKQRSTSSLQIAAAASSSSKKQQQVSQTEQPSIIEQQASGSKVNNGGQSTTSQQQQQYHNQSNANLSCISDVQQQRQHNAVNTRKSRQSLTASIKDQTSSHRSLLQPQQQQTASKAADAKATAAANAATAGSHQKKSAAVASGSKQQNSQLAQMSNQKAASQTKLLQQHQHNQVQYHSSGTKLHHHKQSKKSKAAAALATESDLLFVTTDDEAAQYYDRLTSLFQETRQKLREFDDDFQRRGKQQQPMHQEGSAASGTDGVKRTHQRSEDTREQKKQKARRITLLSSPDSVISDGSELSGGFQQCSIARARESLLSELNRHEQTLKQQKAKQRQDAELAKQQAAAAGKQHQRQRPQHRKTATAGSLQQLSLGGAASSSSILYRRQQHALNSSEKRQRRERGGRFGAGEATDAEHEERKFIAQKAKKKSFINLDDGLVAFDGTDKLHLVNHHKRFNMHHSAPRRQKGLQPCRSMLEEDGRDANQYYGDDIHLSKEKYATNSTTKKEEPLQTAAAVMIDDYYQTNDESIDFMVNSRGKKKGENAASGKPQVATTKTNNKQLHTTKQQRESKNKEQRRKAAAQQNKSSYDYPTAHQQEALEPDPHHRQIYQQPRGSLQQLPTTNATIYINNLMNGVQQQDPGEAALAIHHHQQQLLSHQSQSQGLLPPEMCRTQSQIVYPTASAAQIFNQQQQKQQQPQSHHPTFINQQYPPPHPQFTTMQTSPQHPMVHHHQHPPPPQQQIVFVPVPVHVQAGQTPAPGIHQVSSAPHFTTATQSQLLDSGPMIGLPTPSAAAAAAAYHQHQAASHQQFLTAAQYHQQQQNAAAAATQAAVFSQFMQQPFTSNSASYLPSYQPHHQGLQQPPAGSIQIHLTQQQPGQTTSTNNGSDRGGQLQQAPAKSAPQAQSTSAGQQPSTKRQQQQHQHQQSTRQHKQQMAIGGHGSGTAAATTTTKNSNKEKEQQQPQTTPTGVQRKRQV